jgi:8-hydroxy-5-deazaflavin:NADPH oxidoreductase
MNIAIIGSGNVGGALAQALLKAKHKIFIGTKLPLSEKSKKLATIVGEDRFASVENAIRQAEVVIITTPPEAVLEIIPQLGDVSNKTIIDATNSIRSKPEPYLTVFHAIQTLAKTKKIVKCFNSTGFENLLNPTYGTQAIDMFVAGGDLAAKEIAMHLAEDIGFGKCYDFGGDDKVVLLEQFAFCWINLAIMQGQGRNIGFGVLKRA